MHYKSSGGRLAVGVGATTLTVLHTALMAAVLDLRAAVLDLIVCGIFPGARADE